MLLVHIRRMRSTYVSLPPLAMHAELSSGIVDPRLRSPLRPLCLALVPSPFPFLTHLTSTPPHATRHTVQHYKKYFEANDPDKGGSFYLQSKIFRAKEFMDEEFKKELGEGEDTEGEGERKEDKR